MTHYLLYLSKPTTTVSEAVAIGWFPTLCTVVKPATKTYNYGLLH